MIKNIDTAYSKQQYLAVEETFGITRIREAEDVGWLHRHEFIEISYVCSGHGVHYLKHDDTIETQAVTRGDVTVVDPNAFHCFVSDSSDDPIVTYNIMFTPEFLDERLSGSSHFGSLNFAPFFSGLRIDPNALAVVHLPQSDSVLFDTMAHRLFTETAKRAIGYIQMIRADLCALIVCLVRAWFYQNEALSAEAKNELIIQEISDHIRGHFSEALDLSALAARFFFSRSYLCRVFKQHTGITLTAYLQKVRMEEACRELIYSNRKLLEIAHNVGYSDYKAFYSVFTAHVGMRPSEYRSRNRIQVPVRE